MKKLFAKIYDHLMAPLEKRRIMKWRKNLLEHAKGKVLEIGAGTGVNFSLYKDCEHITAIEPNPFMLEKAERKKTKANVPITLIEEKAERLPFEDNSFDTIVVMLVLCSVDDPVQSIEEIKRVLKPDGLILFLEHVEMDQTFLKGLQNMLNPVWKRVCDGCHLNRRTESMIRESGLKIVSKQSYLSGLAISLVATK